MEFKNYAKTILQELCPMTRISTRAALVTKLVWCGFISLTVFGCSNVRDNSNSTVRENSNSNVRHSLNFGSSASSHVDGFSINGYTGTINMSWSIQEPEIIDQQSFETKVVTDTVEVVHNTAQQYPDLTHIVVNQTFNGPNDPYNRLVRFDQLESMRQGESASQLKSSIKMRREKYSASSELPNFVYLTKAQQEQQAAEAEKQQAAADKQAAVERQAILEKNAEEKRQAAVELAAKVEEEAAAERQRQKEAHEKEVQKEQVEEKMGHLARRRASNDQAAQDLGAQRNPPSRINRPSTAEGNRENEADHDLDELSKLAKQRHQKAQENQP